MFLLSTGWTLLGAWAEEGENTRVLDSGQAPAPATIEDVSWLIGYWRGEGLGGETEEVWSKPSAGSMMGMFRLNKGGKPWFYELITIAEEDGSLLMRLKHFGPDLTGWEEKGPGLSFPLVAIGPDAAFFDGITYRKSDEDTLQVFVRDQQKDGSFRELAFVFGRVN